MHLLVPRSRSSAKVKVKYKGYISQKNGSFGGIRVSQTHLVQLGLLILYQVPHSQALAPAYMLLFSYFLNVFKRLLPHSCLTHYKTTNFRLFRIERLADDNFKFDENGRKLSKPVENTVGKGEIACYEQFPVPTVFSKGLFPRGVKRCHCVGMG